MSENTMKPKTFKAKAWMIAGIHKMAHDQDISDGEWLRRVVLKELANQGYNPDEYFNTNNH